LVSGAFKGAELAVFSPELLAAAPPVLAASTALELF
jgi:hypothetical protein